MSAEYVPDNWVVFKIDDEYKVLAGWSGSYLVGSSWRLSSGISDVEDHGTYWRVLQYSGSVYYCNKVRYGLSMAIGDMYQQIIDLGFNLVTMEEVALSIKGSIAP